MGHRDAHWSCEELLGTEGPGKPADTEALGKETNQTRTGGVGSGLTHDCTTPSSARGSPKEDQALGLTQKHPRAPRAGAGWHIQEAVISSPSHPHTLDPSAPLVSGGTG